MFIYRWIRGFSRMPLPSMVRLKPRIPSKAEEPLKSNLGVEMLQDIRDYDAVKTAIERGEQEVIPSEVAYAILDGENLIKVWREYRGLTQLQLAEAVGISTPYLSQIEKNKLSKRKPLTGIPVSDIISETDISITDISGGPAPWTGLQVLSNTERYLCPLPNRHLSPVSP